MKKLDVDRVEQIIQLRRTGHSLPEILQSVNCGYGTVWRYIRDVKVDKKYQDILRIKKGGSKARADVRWQQARTQMLPLIGNLQKRDKLLILAALYWGEGTKSELNIINSDAELLRVFLICIEELGVSRHALSFSLRTFEDISLRKAKQYWAKQLDIPVAIISSAEIKRAKKIGKLPYGMCRIRMRKGERYFKQIMSMIQLIASQTNGPRSSMDRTAAS